MNISYPARVPHSLLNKSTSLGLSSTNYAEGIPPVDHVPNMTGMIQPLRKSIDIKRCKGFCKLIWTDESVKAFHFCWIAVSNCQELYLLKGTPIPILQNNGIGGYMYIVTISLVARGTILYP